MTSNLRFGLRRPEHRGARRRRPEGRRARPGGGHAHRAGARPGRAGSSCPPCRAPAITPPGRWCSRATGSRPAGDAGQRRHRGRRRGRRGRSGCSRVHTRRSRVDAARSPWHDDLREVRGRPQGRRRCRSDDGVVGDFNATRDHPAFRSILGLGLRDAAEQADAGWQRHRGRPSVPRLVPAAGDHRSTTCWSASVRRRAHPTVSTSRAPTTGRWWPSSTAHRPPCRSTVGWSDSTCARRQAHCHVETADHHDRDHQRT